MPATIDRPVHRGGGWVRGCSIDRSTLINLFKYMRPSVLASMLSPCCPSAHLLLRRALIAQSDAAIPLID